MATTRVANYVSPVQAIMYCRGGDSWIKEARMARPFDFGEIHLTAGGDPSPASPSRDTPFRIAILSDLSGRSSRKQTAPDIANCRAVEVDRDNFDKVFANTSVGISLSMERDAPLELQFSELDDFHPDQLLERAPMFAKLRNLRARVADPDEFSSVAQELGLQETKPERARSQGATGRSPSTASIASNLAAGSLLDATVEQTEHGRASGAPPSRAANELDAFVRRVTEPHLVAAADPRQAEALAMIDRALSAQMRALLHVPVLQDLEATWRAIYLLVRRIETSPQLKIYLFDILKEELAADLGAAPDLRASGIYRLIVEKSVGTPGADPWALIVGDYEFGPDRKDAELLAKLARGAKAVGAPFLAAASPQLLGCASLAETPLSRDWQSPADAEGAAAWAALRGLPEATSIGLALPRFLLRLPYGKKTDPVESFDFEEMTRPPNHEDYLWGSPAFACTLLLAQSFSDDAWDMRPGTHSQIDGLPLHVYEQDGVSELKPCAEALLTEEAVERILDTGVMPLVSLKGQDSVRLVRFQSIAEPPHSLGGRWNGK
jgi:type VI secretion system protein ImpC